MLFLNLFPVPRRYGRIPGALAFALTAAMALFFAKERTPFSIALLIVSIVLLLFVYFLRYQHKQEWSRFFHDENQRLLNVRGSSGPAHYVPIQRIVVSKLRHPELKAQAQLNLSTGLLANADPCGSLEVLEAMDPTRLPNPTMILLYWTQMLSAYLQLSDTERAEAAYQMAMEILPQVSDMLKISFMPVEIQYRLSRGEFELALNQLGEIPLKDLDDSSRDLLTTMRVVALRGMGAIEKSNILAAQIQTHDLLPSTRALLKSSIT